LDREDLSSHHSPTFAPPSTYALPPYEPNTIPEPQVYSIPKTTTTTTTTTTTFSSTYSTYTTTPTTIILSYSSSPTTNYIPISTSSNVPISQSTSYFTTTTTSLPPTYRASEEPIQTSYSTKPSIMEVLRSNDLTVMATLLEESGLEPMLNQKSYGSFTVFAPTDTAFNEFFEPMGGVITGVEKLKQNPNDMKKVFFDNLKKIYIGTLTSEQMFLNSFCALHT